MSETDSSVSKQIERTRRHKAAWKESDPAGYDETVERMKRLAVEFGAAVDHPVD